MVHQAMRQIIHLCRNLFACTQAAGFAVVTVLVIHFPIIVSGQNVCNNPPSLNLSESSGTTCNRTPVTISGNTFGGSATRVTITENGHGSVSPSSSTSSPFSFTYNTENHDAGRVVIITVTTNNPEGSPCDEATATYVLTVTSSLPSPVIETIIQPTCTSSTGSVGLSGLPSGSDWTVTVSPGGVTMDGSGTTATIVDLMPGIYTFVVSVSASCSSSSSAQAEIIAQPGNPSPPVPGTIIAPTCSIATGSVSLSGLPSPGSWTLTRYPGTIKTIGTGTSTTVSGLDAGLYNFSITNESGCTSGLSGEVTIPAKPPSPAIPAIGEIIQPTVLISTGSVTLTALPSTGTWTIILSPGEVPLAGSGTALTITGLVMGTYTFKVRNSDGCLSAASPPVTISAPAPPEVVITDPPALCFPATADLTAPEIKEGSTGGLTYTYWTDSLATAALETPAAAGKGIFYIKGTAPSGYSDIKPVTVTVRQSPSANAGPDQIISNNFNSILEAEIGEEESGIWYSDSDSIIFNDRKDPRSTVSNLSAGENVLSWIVTNGVCPADTDKVTITVGDLIIPTLITPNGDSKNEYFVIQGIETSIQTELTIFDRRGIQVFQDSNYDNKWNGVDYNKRPLINDTYFFILKLHNGRCYRGYILIRK